jgi:hypothetical protein
MGARKLEWRKASYRSRKKVICITKERVHTKRRNKFPTHNFKLKHFLIYKSLFSTPLPPREVSLRVHRTHKSSQSSPFRQQSGTNFHPHAFTHSLTQLAFFCAFALSGRADTHNSEGVAFVAARQGKSSPD